MTYANLQANVKAWLNREDLDSQIPTFIELADASLRRQLAGSTAIEAVTGGNWLLTSHPDVYLYASLVEASPYLRDDPRVALWQEQLDRRVAEVKRSRNATAIALTTQAGLQAAVTSFLDRSDLVAAVPLFCTLGEQRIQRAMAGATEIAALTGSTTNWFFDAHPDVYLYAALCESAPYLGDDPRLAVWRSELDTRLAEAHRARTATVADLTTAAGLQAAVVQYVDRNDLVGMAAAFVSLGEQALMRRLREWGGEGIVPISEAGTNWLFSQHPDVYLYAALCESAPYVGDDPRLATWRTELETRLTDVLTFGSADEYHVPLRRAFTGIGA